MGSCNLEGNLDEKLLSDDIKADALKCLLFIGQCFLEFSGDLSLNLSVYLVNQ